MLETLSEPLIIDTRAFSAGMFRKTKTISSAADFLPSARDINNHKIKYTYQVKFDLDDVALVIVRV